MATLDFPTSPSVGQQYPNPSVVGQPTYKWDGEKWTTNASTGSGSSSFTQYEYTATAGQTTFSGADISGNTLQYTVGFLEVYLNGNLLNKADFTASSGSSVVLPALALNDQVTIIALGFSNIAMLPTNNLSDVSNAATARTNLGAAPLASPSFTGNVTASTGAFASGNSANSGGQFDVTGAPSFSIANTANAQVLTSGLGVAYDVTIIETAIAGYVGKFICTNGNQPFAVFASSTNFVSGVNVAAKISFGFDGTNFRIYNNLGAGTATFRVLAIRIA